MCFLFDYFSQLFTILILHSNVCPLVFPTYAHELWASQAAPAGHLLFMKWCISRHCMRQAKLLVPPQSSSISLPIWTNFHYTSDWKLCRTQHPQQQTCGEKRKFLTPFLGTMLCYVLVASYILTRWNVFKIGWETVQIRPCMHQRTLQTRFTDQYFLSLKMLSVNFNSTFYYETDS